MSNWVSVKDRVPELEVPVLCVNKLDEMRVCTYERPWADENPVWYYAHLHIFIPTHWMPLPEAPK